jgi:hopanoid biosynthesis associated radical SAM protein HpnH
MGRPLYLSARLGGYIVKNIFRPKFPLVTILEPIEGCNLSCEGCGRIREYENKKLSVEESIAAVEESNTPIVSISGGEPLLHPRIDEIIRKIIQRKRFVYLCTNGLLLGKALEGFKPSKYLCFVVHLDGMEERHDRLTGRKGTFKTAVHAIKKAKEMGFRVCTNTTIYKESDIEDLRRLFSMLAHLGVEGMMISPAYAYQVISKDIFLGREESIKIFRSLRDFKFYNSSLYLEFLRGERRLSCTAWTTPTYTPLGWRKPCYTLADGHTPHLEELMEDSLWERYGPGKDPRCENCMMHSGFEAGSILEFLKLRRNERK